MWYEKAEKELSLNFKHNFNNLMCNFSKCQNTTVEWYECVLYARLLSLTKTKKITKTRLFSEIKIKMKPYKK